jgi:hypothetical protein
MKRQHVYIPEEQIDEIREYIPYDRQFSFLVRTALELLLERLRRGESIFEIAGRLDESLLSR